MRRITINTGHITNSSSVVHHFDKKLIEDPAVASFMRTYGIEDGVVGSDLWHRGHCASVLLTSEQKAEAQSQLTGANNPYGSDTYGPSVGTGDDEVVVIYGDEYTTFASTLCGLLSQAADRNGSGDRGGTSYN